MNAIIPVPMDRERFYRWNERQERRHELVGGRPVMMTRASRNHNLVCSNLMALLFAQLDRRRWAIMHADFAVEIGEQIRYPDIVVEPHREDGAIYHADNATLIVEVLSTSSLYADLSQKPSEYLCLPSLMTYAVLSQDEPAGWLWTRDGSIFPHKPAEIVGLEASLDVPSLGLALPLTGVYAGVRLSS